MDETTLAEQAQSAASLLVRLMRHLFAMGHDAAEELSLPQIRVCGTLYFEGPRPMSTLSREMGVTLSAMTQIADRLERAGLVERVAEGTDRRIRCLRLTGRGEKIMRRRDEDRVRRVAAVFERLTPEAREEALVALARLNEACGFSVSKVLS